MHPWETGATNRRLFYGDVIDQILRMQDLIFDGNTRIDVRDATTGRHVGTAAVGTGACSMAVDEPAHQVLVACAGGKVYRRPGWKWQNWAHHWLPFLPAAALAQVVNEPASLALIDEGRL